jgi:predicted nucleic acid-binding protein
VEALLSSMQVLPTSMRAARQAGIWRYDFARQGQQLASTDCLIAAIAHEQRAILITGNLREYPMPELRQLPLPRRR